MHGQQNVKTQLQLINIIIITSILLLLLLFILRP